MACRVHKLFGLTTYHAFVLRNSKTTASGTTTEKLDQILLNGNHVTMVRIGAYRGRVLRACCANWSRSLSGADGARRQSRDGHCFGTVIACAL